jgi:hypothetical protein
MPDYWDLKFELASQRVDEIAHEVDAFAGRAVYRAALVHQLDDPERRHYRLEFTEHPNPLLAVMVAEVFHDIRTALNHLVIAYVPESRKGKAGFPIFRDRPFDDSGNIRNDKIGKAWTKLITGLPELLAEQVKQVQPFNGPPPVTLAFCEANGLDPYDIQGLGLLARLNNEDKHEEPIKVVFGLEDVVVTYRCPATSPVTEKMDDGFLPNGGALLPVELHSIPPGQREKVEVQGTVRVAIEISELGVTGLPGSMVKLVNHGREIAVAFERLAAGLPAVDLRTDPPV